MTEAAEKALLEQPDTKTKIGRRDQFLMIFLYDTGARIQEVLDIKICDIRIDKTPTVALHGKGKKIRSVPLMKDTARRRSPKYAGAAREKCPDVPENVSYKVDDEETLKHLYGL